MASLLRQLAQSLLVTYLVLLLAEQLQTGFVTDYLNPTPFLVLAAVCAAANRPFQRIQPTDDRKTQGMLRPILETLIIASVAGVVVIHLTLRIGPPRWGMGALLVGLLTLLLVSLQQQRRGNNPVQGVDDSTDHHPPPSHHPSSRV